MTGSVSLSPPPRRSLPWRLRLSLLVVSPTSQGGWLLVLAAGLVAVYARNADDVSRATRGLWAAIVVAALLAGLALVARGTWRGRQSAQLLARGRVTRGRLIEKTFDDDDTFDSPLTLIYVFEDAKGVIHRHRVRAVWPESDGDQPTIVHDPRDPRRATVPAFLPGQPRIRPDGTIEAREDRALVRLSLPLAALMSFAFLAFGLV